MQIRLLVKILAGETQVVGNRLRGEVHTAQKLNLSPFFLTNQLLGKRRGAEDFNFTDHAFLFVIFLVAK